MEPFPISQQHDDGREPNGGRRSRGLKRSMWGVVTGALIFPVDEVIIHWGPTILRSPPKLIFLQVGVALLIVFVSLWKRGRHKWNTRR